MEKYTLNINDVHNLITEALLILDKASRESGCIYYLHAGTVLGAIRHNNLIPWDDDADIIVPSYCYSKFVNYLKTIDLGKFKIIYRDEKSTKMQAKLILNGQDEDLICIDIFPLIGTSNDYKKQLCQCKKATNLRKLYFWKKQDWRNSTNVLKKVIKFGIKIILFVFSEKWFNKKFDEILYQYRFEDSQYVTNPCGKYKLKNVIPKDWYGTPSDGIIGNNLFPIPSHFDEYLRHYYKDYMKHPDKEYQNSIINKERFFIGTKEEFEKCTQQ